MATITPTKYGHRAQIKLRGVRDSATFRTAREAKAWAAARETDIRTLATTSPAHRHTLGDVLKEYAKEVAPAKRSARWIENRIKAFLREPEFPAATKLADLTTARLAIYRDARLRRVGPGTVKRELGLLSAALETARREWGWIAANPLRDVRKPTEPDHRDVVISAAQIRAMLRTMHYRRGPCLTVTQAVATAFLLALRTGMRAGEICTARWDEVHADYMTVRGKTGRRDVPLTYPARRLVEMMRGYDPVLVFGIGADSLSALFLKYRKRADLSGFTFHDTRHTAATRLAQRLHVLDLCKVFGWTNTTMALTYYNPSASQIAGRLSRRFT